MYNKHHHLHRRVLQLTSSSMATSTTSLNSNNSNGDIDINILCLHGKGGNGEQFINKSLQPLRSMLDKRCKDNNISFNWDTITAPYQISPPTNKEEDDGGYAWWTMPPGVRSYNANEYIGFDASEEIVLDKFFESDIILGHSQGAILTAALLSKHDTLWNTALDESPMGYILNGVAWPNPYAKALESLATEEINNSASLPSMLFVMGKEDNINPIESAIQVHDVYKKGNFDVSIVNHDRGHSVPGRDDNSIRALEEICDWIIDNAKRKAIIDLI